MSNFFNSKNVDDLNLIKKFNIDVSDIEVVSSKNLCLNHIEKALIIEKTLEAYEFAKINLKCGNITKRGFASNVCTNDGIWALGTNFNNTRNEISSVCGERSAILAAYNLSLLSYMQNANLNDCFDFKVKYICMSQALDLSKIEKATVPCEDCLSWFNTSRYFSNDTVVFSFERNNQKLCIKAVFLDEFLPYRNILTSNKFCSDKKIIYSVLAKKSADEKNIDNSMILNLVKLTYKSYLNNNLSALSNQNISCSIFANEKIYTLNKIDWTKRWFSEPLFACIFNATTENQDKTCVDAICYFGDEISKNDGAFNDGVVSIKGLGRIRQKYANDNTLLILNYNDNIFVTTIGEYLPMKFIQGYKI